MNIRRFKALRESGTTYAEIARECGVDYRTVKKYLAADAAVVPPAGSPRVGTQPRAITPAFEAVIRALLTKDVQMPASVIHERLVSEHGFTGHYQRVKMACRELRPLVEDELDADDEVGRLRGLHRRFTTVPGAQAQVDWGHEGDLLGDGRQVYSFHMTLSYSRDPFCCYVTSMDTGTWWSCHVRAFEHFGGVPTSIVYDRTKTIMRKHVVPGKAVPLQASAVAFAGHYGFTIDVLAAYRPTGKGRVERQVKIVRDHVLPGREFTCLDQVNAAFASWLVIRRGQVHRTHGEVIGVRARVDHAALAPLPATEFIPTVVHLRRVGKDCLIAFEGSHYSLPATKIRAHQRVEVRASEAQVNIYATWQHGGELLASHPRASRSGSWMVDQAHWDGLPDGRTRSTTTVIADLEAARGKRRGPRGDDPPAHVARALRIEVGARPLSDYATAAGLEDAR